MVALNREKRKEKGQRQDIVVLYTKYVQVNGNFPYFEAYSMVVTNIKNAGLARYMDDSFPQ